MSGRQQEMVKKPSQTNSRDGQPELGYDNYGPHHHDSRNKQPMQYQESSSHYRGRNREREMPGDPHERREHGWHVRYGRSDQVHSRPGAPVGRSEKRPNVDERVVHMNPPQVDNQRGYKYVEYEEYNDGRGRFHYVDGAAEDYNTGGHKRREHSEYEEYNYGKRYGYAEYEYYNNEPVRKSNHGHGYDDTAQINKGEYSERRFLVPVEDSRHEQGYVQNHGHGQGYEQDSQPVRLQRQDHGQGYEQDPKVVRVRQDRGHGQGYGQTSQSYPTMERRRYKEENERYQEIPPEEYMENYYKDKEKHVHQSIKFSHPPSPPQFKDFGNQQQFPKVAPPSTSSGVIRDDVVDIHPLDGYPPNHHSLENLVVREYGQRPQLDPRYDYEAAGCADGQCHQCDLYAYSWNEQEDYPHDAYAESRGKIDPGYRTREVFYREDHSHARADSEYRYIQRVAISKHIPDSPIKAEGSQRIYRHNGLRELEVSQKEEIPGREDSRKQIGTSKQEADCLNSGYAPVEFPRRASQELQPRNPIGTSKQEADCLISGYAPVEFPRRASQELQPRNPIGTSKQEADCLNSGYAPVEFSRRASQELEPRKPVGSSKQEVDCLDSGYAPVEFSTRASQELQPRKPVGSSKQEADCLNSGYAPVEFSRRASQELQPNEASVLQAHEISAYDNGRYVNVAKSREERVKSSGEFVDAENRYTDEQVACNRMVKRKYIQGDEAREFSLGTTGSNKWSTYSGSQQIKDRRPEWNKISSSGLHSQAPSGREPNLFLEAKAMMNEINHHKDTGRYGWSNQGKYENMQEQSGKSYEPGRKYMKVHSKSEYPKAYGRSNYINHRNDRGYKQHYVGKRGEDENGMDVIARDHNFTEDPKGPPLKYDLCDEDSEGFKQSVLAAFLMYSKKLNDNPPIRRLYKHQGNSGTLFCIVCGRSTSKVFRDTEGLTRHSFMARKASLRAQHLGLHRAICVLMGWGPEVPPENETWMPVSLPKPEAMSQKEDLIIWQPTVIFHNISLSNNNHQAWKAISLESLEAIIIAKSFIRSKIKICLGHPGDQSVMLVKFLGTFTGLQEAEKLHKYFAESGRGREDFERALFEMNNNKSEQETVEEESLLFGYIGIAEDLDRIDLDTKKRCKIQSKMEIQVLVDAPLKRD